ncbi:hypothetical protein CLOM_g926 [Closterium sp. NIES-68]|nr:hypothetical protein CLOM_g926 [Closterium sp. NIES-68]
MRDSPRRATEALAGGMRDSPRRATEALAGGMRDSPRRATKALAGGMRDSPRRATKALARGVEQEGGRKRQKKNRKVGAKRSNKRVAECFLGSERKRVCKMCEKPMGFKDSQTSTGAKHMARHHRPHWDIWQRRVVEGLEPGESFPMGGYPHVPDGKAPNEWSKTWPHPPPGATIPSLSPAAADARQPTMDRFLGPRVSEPRLRQAIVEFIASTDSSFRIVEDPAFRRLLAVCNPQCGDAIPIPDRTTVSRDLRFYSEAARAVVKSEFGAGSGSGRVSFTTDIWTGGNRRGYMTVTAHFISRDFQLRQCTLEFMELGARHTGRLIADVFARVIREWELVGFCMGVTTDNASSNTAAMRRLAGLGCHALATPLLADGMHFRCLAHIPYLAVQRALKLPAVRVPLKLLRDIATFVGWSERRTREFEAQQRSDPVLKGTVLRLVQDSEVRWGSTHEMVARALRLRRSLTAHFAVEQGETAEERAKYVALRLTDAHWDTLDVLAEFLAPFSSITVAAEGSSYPTSSAVVPQFNELMDTLQAWPSPRLIGRQLVGVAFPVLERYYCSSSDELVVATFLNPRHEAGVLRGWIKETEKLGVEEL